jgi:hypothetical protein
MRRDELEMNKRKAICFPKFTSTKKATSLLRYLLRLGYDEESLASPNPPQRKIDAH